MIRKSLLSFSIAAMVILTGLCWSQSSAQTPSDTSAQSVTDQDIDLIKEGCSVTEEADHRLESSAD